MVGASTPGVGTQGERRSVAPEGCHGTVASGCIFLLDNDDLLLTPDLSTPDDGAAGQKDKKDEETPDKPKP